MPKEILRSAFIVAMAAALFSCDMLVSGLLPHPGPYSVTYNSNGATGGTSPTDTAAYPYGQTVTVLGNTGNLAEAGRVFAGWNTQSNGSGISYTQGQTFRMGSSNVTFYATWTLTAGPAYNVTYNGNGNDGGAVPTDGTSYPAGGMVTVLGPGTLSLSSGVFAGWNTAANGSGTTYSSGNTFAMSAGNLTLFAVWLPVSGTTITSIPLSATDIAVPAGVTDFGTTFRAHPNLVRVTIPSTIASIVVQAFIGCPNLTTIVSNSARFQVINGALVDTATSTLMLVPAKLSGTFTIPSVTSIDPYAFDQCTNLTGITIPASLTTISGNGFSGLQSAIPVTLPPTVTAVAAYGFYNSSVTSITIPASVTSIGAGAMGQCNGLTNVDMQGLTPPLLGAAAFTTPYPTIHVPNSAAVAAYQADPTWSVYGAIVTP